MKKFRFLVMILVGFMVILSSGLVDANVLSFLPDFIKPMDGLSIAVGLAVGDVVSEYGSYYEKGNQNASRLLKLLMQPAVTEKFMTPIKTDDTLFKLANGTIDDIVQPFQKAFTEAGTLTFKPMPIQLFHIKVDFSLYPDDIEATWLGFLASSDLKRTDWPMVRYAWEQYLVNKIKDNMELKEIYKGVYASPTPGAAGATGTSMDGLQKLLQDGVDDTTIHSIPLDAFSSSNAFDQIEEFVDGMDDLYQGVKMNIFCDPQIYKYYMRDKRAQGFYYVNSDKDIGNGIDFMPQVLVPLPSMAGTDELFATPTENLLWVTKKDVNKTRFELQGVDRQVKMLTDWWEGVGFGINEAVWTNIVAES
jgi:hypothetical protein